MIRGQDFINPLLHLSDTSMVQSLSLQFNVAGTFLEKTKSKQSTLETRQERKERRTTTKMWILFAVDYFTSRLEVSHDDWCIVLSHSGHQHHHRLGILPHFD